MCECKVRHSTLSGAMIALRKTRNITGRCDCMAAYACDFCGGWHVGHVKAKRLTRAEYRTYAGGMI